MNILFPLNANRVRPINNSLKKICLSVASAYKDNSNIRVFGLVEEVVVDMSFRQLNALGVEILDLSSKGIVQEMIKARLLIKNNHINIIHCGGYKQLLFFCISTLFMMSRPSIIMTDRNGLRWKEPLAIVLSSMLLWLTKPYLHVLNKSHFDYLTHLIL